MAKKSENVCSELDKIARLEADNVWVKQAIISIEKKQDKMLDILTKGDGKISDNRADLQMIKKDMYSNGKTGALERIDLHETYIDKQKGAMFVTKILSGIIGAVSGLFVTLIPIILGFFIKK